jgi:hypothetical protein
MGVGPTALRLYEDLLGGGHFKPGMSVCELGSQDFVPKDYRGRLVPDVMRKEKSARAFYESLGMSYECIDINGEHGALQLDLNFVNQVNIGRRFDLVTNHGTTEHVFNQVNCFRLIHDLTLWGGLMIHVVPTQGYYRHGFYSYSSLLFELLAAANGYETIRQYDEDDRYGALIVVVLRKLRESAFVLPVQKVYGGTVPVK